jgi:CheY-like chemotaxis protein
MIVDLVHAQNNLDEDLRNAGLFGPPFEATLGRPMKTILLAEDDADDIFMMRLACERSGILHRLEVVTDGAMAVDYLCGKSPYDNRILHPVPDIIFLDINMPMQSGFEILKLIRAKPAFKKLPVIMLTNSPVTTEVDLAFQLGVSSYLRKIPNLVEFQQAIRAILKYWLESESPK